MTLDAWEEMEDEQQILENIAEYGCHITIVSPPEEGDEDFIADLHSHDDPEEDDRFAYSVGFPRTVGQPEVIVFGFSTELAASVINGVMDMCREGFVMEDWKEIDGLLKGHRVMLRAVEPENLEPYYFNSAMWFAEQEMGTEMTRAFQIVWPGVDDGLYPWDKGCSDVARDLQTPLYRTSLNS